LTTVSERPERAVVAAAVDVLRSGGIVAYATDTLYGLAADPRSEAAVERLFDLKGRSEHAPIPLIAADSGQAFATGRFDDLARRLARAFWPGPLTLVVPVDTRIAPRILAGGSTIAIRVPAHAVARALARELGSPITSTSANLSGRPAPADAAQLDPALADRLDAVLDSGPAPGGAPSTIVEATPAGLRLLREGAIPWERVLRSATE
jgi:L-threonylcarbamoyladenylate synthase